MCGIVGIYSHEAVAAELYDSLIHLQHRGQDAAGILTSDHANFYPKHGLGLVREIFSPDDIAALQGNVGIAHTRYPTAGGYSKDDIQPLALKSPNHEIALAHNGNLVNYHELAQAISENQDRQLNRSVDSEALLFMLEDALTKRTFGLSSSSQQFFDVLCDAVKVLFQRVIGSYSIVSLIKGKGLFAVRDPHGIRPLVYGERKCEDGSTDYIFASETTVFYALGFEPKGDVRPGEVMYVNDAGELFRAVIGSGDFKPCVFEYVYFARPDSTLDSVSVYRSRLRMGQNLAKHFKKVYPDVLPDVVVPAPFTANTAALSFAHELGVRYSEGLYKNPFIGRTFIMANQKARSRNVRYKLTPQRTEIENKKVLIVDDSIVRGTTSREIVKMIREFGAKAIYFVSACPPIKHPCFYGIDIPSRNELIAAVNTEEEVREFLGVDLLLYQTEDDLVEAVTRRGDHHMVRPCMACMDGQYVCRSMTKEKMATLEQKRLSEKK
jgi:amidophosphoribosyltransferase